MFARAAGTEPGESGILQNEFRPIEEDRLPRPNSPREGAYARRRTCRQVSTRSSPRRNRNLLLHCRQGTSIRRMHSVSRLLHCLLIAALVCSPLPAGATAHTADDQGMSGHENHGSVGGPGFAQNGQTEYVPNKHATPCAGAITCACLSPCDHPACAVSATNTAPAPIHFQAEDSTGAAVGVLYIGPIPNRRLRPPISNHLTIFGAPHATAPNEG